MTTEITDLDHLRATIAAAGPKGWPHALKRNPAITAWIQSQTADLASGTSMAVRVYTVLHDDPPTCPLGRERKLKSLQTGYGFCGRTSFCACAKASVARNVSATKAMASAEQKMRTQAKRETTNLAVHGHRNSAQTESARAAHRRFYADTDNVKNQLLRHVATMLDRYGVENPAQVQAVSEKRSATLIQRYGVANPMQIKSVALRSLATRLANGYCEDYYRRNYDRLKARLLVECGVDLLTPFEQYDGVASRPNLEFRCTTCPRVFSWRLDYGHFPHCVVCRPTPINYKSKEELEIFDFVRGLGISDVISGERSLINPYELDIVSETHKIAIEYCGLYWHSETRRPKHGYHLEKLKRTEQRGYRLLTIFADEWLDKPELVKSKIAHLFNKIDDRRFARKLQVIEVNHAAASAFYEQWHLQGATTGCYHVALAEGATSVAMMSFARARASHGLPANGFELVRFASQAHTAIVGGASRLFSQFVKRHAPSAVVSYADRRWSEGGLYRQLGFRLDRVNPPSYSYLENYTKRYFRFNFRKDILASALGDLGEAKEWEIMRALDYDRIWDCGSYRFLWTP